MRAIPMPTPRAGSSGNDLRPGDPRQKYLHLQHPYGGAGADSSSDPETAASLRLPFSHPVPGRPDENDPAISSTSYTSMPIPGQPAGIYPEAEPDPERRVPGPVPKHRLRQRRTRPERPWEGRTPTIRNILTHGWIGSADWKPYKVLSLFGEYQGAQFDNPYTRISPESENIGKVRIKYDTPMNNLNLDGTGLWRRRANPDQDYRVDVKDFSLGAAYQPSFLPKLTADASFTYQMIQNEEDITNGDFTPTSPTIRVQLERLDPVGRADISRPLQGIGGQVLRQLRQDDEREPSDHADGVISV